MGLWPFGTVCAVPCSVGHVTTSRAFGLHVSGSRGAGILQIDASFCRSATQWPKNGSFLICLVKCLVAPKGDISGFHLVGSILGHGPRRLTFLALAFLEGCLEDQFRLQGTLCMPWRRGREGNLVFCAVRLGYICMLPVIQSEANNKIFKLYTWLPHSDHVQ